MARRRPRCCWTPGPARTCSPRRRRRRPPVGPPGDDDPPADSLEWLIEAAASIGTALGRRGARAAGGHRRRRADPDVRPRAARPRGAARPAGGRRPPPGCPACAPASSRCAGRPATGRWSACSARSGPTTSSSLVRGRSGPATDAAVLLDIGQLGRRRAPAAAGAALGTASARRAGRPARRGRRPCCARPAGGWPSRRPTGRSPTSGRRSGRSARGVPAGPAPAGAGMNAPPTVRRAAAPRPRWPRCWAPARSTPGVRLRAPGSRRWSRVAASSSPAGCCCAAAGPARLAAARPAARPVPGRLRLRSALRARRRSVQLLLVVCAAHRAATRRASASAGCCRPWPACAGRGRGARRRRRPSCASRRRRRCRCTACWR